MQHKPSAAKGGWKPALALVVLTPMVGELLTSSAPPFVFFIPWVFILFVLLYGCGALLIREISVRWNSGWPGILLLGAAYGILEESLGAKSFFDPHWRALGMLGSYGRWLDVNWVWTIGLILFHSGFCIGLSILAASLPYPQLRRAPWLAKKWLWLVGFLYALDLWLFFEKGNENHYRAPNLYYAVSIAGAVLLILAARFWPRQADAHDFSSQVPVSRLFWLGFLSMVAFVALLYGLPPIGVPALFTACMLVVLAVVIAVLLQRWSDNGQQALTEQQQFWLVAGSFGCFALQAPLQEMNPSRPDSARGMTAVGIAFLLYLWWLWARVGRAGILAKDRITHGQ